MNPNEKYDNSWNPKQFCSDMKRLQIDDYCETSGVGTSSNMSEENVAILLNIASSPKPYKLKRDALSQLKSIFENWPTNWDSGSSFFDRTKSCILELFINEENDKYRRELTSLVVILIEITNETKIDKWEVIFEVVTACVALSKRDPTETILNLVIEHPTLFGKDVNNQLLQYNQLLKKCFEGFPKHPKVTLFAVDLLEGVFVKYDKSIACVMTLSNLIPSILVSMKALINTKHGENYMESVNYLFYDCRGLFEDHITEIVRTLIDLLQNTEAVPSADCTVYPCLATLVSAHSETIIRRNKDIIPVIIENMIDYKISSYPDGPIEWLIDSSICSDIFLSQKDAFAQYCFNNIICSLGLEAVRASLYPRINELLESSNWKHITTAIESLTILGQNYGKYGTPEPLDLFAKILPFFAHQNSKVVYSAIKLTQCLCEIFNGKEFVSFHREALSLIIESVAAQTHLLVNIKVIEIVGDIVRKCPCENYDISSNGIIKLFVEIMEFAFVNNENDFTKDTIRSIAHNIECIYTVMGDRASIYSARIVVLLMNMFDKSFILPHSGDLAHIVMDCVMGVISRYSLANLESIVGLIVTHIDIFNKLHHLSANYLEIQPCFFSLIWFLAKYRTNSLEKLIPRVGFSIVRYLSAIKETDMRSVEKTMDHLVIPPPFGCGFCFHSKRDGGFQSICELVSTLIENYNDIISPFIEIYLNIIYNILIKIEDDWRRIDFIKGTQKIISHIVLYGDASIAVNHWNNQLKDALLVIMKKCQTDQVIKMIRIFTKCVTLLNFDDVLTSADIHCVGKILDNAVFIFIQLIWIFFPPTKHCADADDDGSARLMVDDNSSDISQNSMGVALEGDLRKLRETVHDLLAVYGEIVIDAIIPMYKTILDCKPTARLGLVFEFLLCVLDDVLDYLDHKSIGESALLPIILDFIMVVLSKFHKSNRLDDTIQIAHRLKDAFPIPFEERLKVLDPPIRSIIEMNLMKS